MEFRQKEMIRRVFPIFCLLFLSMNFDEGMAMGSQDTRQVIALHCPQEVPNPEALCQAMIASLSEASPASDIRALEKTGTFQAKSGDIEVTLHLESVSEINIGGYLEWRAGTSGDIQRGPRVDLDVMDAEIKPASYAQFTNGLIRATPKLLSN